MFSLLLDAMIICLCIMTCFDESSEDELIGNVPRRHATSQMPSLSFCAFQKRNRDGMSNLPFFLVRVSVY